MGTVKRFEDLEIWQEGRLLTQQVYRMTKEGSFAKDFALKDQLRRASISIVTNIAEGFERDANKEMIYFLSIAKASAGEVLCLLYLALDEAYINKALFESTSAQLNRLMKKTTRLIQYLQRSNLKGSRYINQK